MFIGSCRLRPSVYFRDCDSNGSGGRPGAPIIVWRHDTPSNIFQATIYKSHLARIKQEDHPTINHFTRYIATWYSAAMTSHICDRCKKTVEPENISVVLLYQKNVFYLKGCNMKNSKPDQEVGELCEACIDELKRFMGNNEIKPV